MLDQDVLNIKEILNKYTENTDDRKKILSIAVGITAGRSVELPEKSVPIPNEYYRSDKERAIKDYIYSVNEQIILNTDFAISVARSYWMIRYYSVYPDPINMIVSEDFDFYCKLSSVDRYVCIEDYKYCNEHKLVLLEIINKLNKSQKQYVGFTDK